LAEAQARDRAVAAGADRASLQTVDVEDMPLAYLPGNALRIRVRVAGEMASRLPALWLIRSHAGHFSQPSFLMRGILACSADRAPRYISLLPSVQPRGALCYFNIAGLRRADLRPLLTQCSPATLSRQLARLRQLGVIKRVTGTYRYYLTRAGRAAIAAGRRLTEQTIIPALAWQICSQDANTEVVSD
jgi:hypothetical protein